MLTRSKEGIYKPKGFMSTIDDVNLKLFEPTTFKQVVRHEHWQHAMIDEFSAL